MLAQNNLKVQETLTGLFLQMRQTQNQIGEIIAMIAAPTRGIGPLNPEIEIIPELKIVSPIDDPDYCIEFCECSEHT